MTPEDILELLKKELGPETGQAAWTVLDRALIGRRLYWDSRMRRALLARTVYAMRSQGRSDTAIAASLRLSTRSIQRLYKSELMRLRTAA